MTVLADTKSWSFLLQSHGTTRHRTSATMCIQTYRVYSCGCKRPEQFIQCAARRGTHVKCTPVTKR